MQRRTFLLTLAGLALPRLTFGASSSAPTLVQKRLPSGLLVLVRENPVAPVVAVSLQMRMGTRWERAENVGISNLLQQVVPKGTKRRTAFEIAEAAERIGGSVAASGDTDFSEVRGAGLARHWQSLLELIADVTLHPTLPPEELENERRAVLSRIRSREDQPFSLAYDTLLRALYDPHPYGLPALGLKEVVERLDRDTLLQHYRRYYRSERMVLVVSGQVSADAVLNELSSLFAGLPGASDAVEPALSSPTPAFSRQVLERPTAQAQIVFGYLAPSLSHPDYAAVKVLNALLGGGMASRMFVELRDKEGLAYSVGAINPSRRDPSFVVLHMGTAADNLARAEDGIKREVERVQQELASADEIARAKAYLLGNLAMDRRTNAREAWYLAFFEIQGVGHDFLSRYMARVEAVTAEDVQRAARSYLNRPTVVILRPTPR